MVLEDHVSAFDRSARTTPSPSMQLFSDRSPPPGSHDQRWPLSCHLGLLKPSAGRGTMTREVCQCGLVLFGNAKHCRRCGRPRGVSTPVPVSELASEDGDILGLKDLARISDTGTDDHLAGGDDGDDLDDDDDPTKQVPTEELLVMLGEIADGVTDYDDMSTSRSPLTTAHSTSTNGLHTNGLHNAPLGTRHAGASHLAVVPSKAAVEPNSCSSKLHMKPANNLHKEVHSLQEQVQEQLEAKDQLQNRLEGEVRELTERSTRQYQEKDALMQRLHSLKEGISSRLQEFAIEQQQLLDRIEAERIANEQLHSSIDADVQNILAEASGIGAQIQEASAKQAALVEDLQAAMDRQSAAQAELQSERVATWRLSNEVITAFSRLNAPPSALSAVESAVSAVLADREGGSPATNGKRPHEGDETNGELGTPRPELMALRRLNMADSPRGALSSRGSPAGAESRGSPRPLFSSLAPDSGDLGSSFRGVAKAAEEHGNMQRECWRMAQRNCELSKELALEESSQHQLEWMLQDADTRKKNAGIDLKDIDQEEALKFYIECGGVKEIGLNAAMYIANALSFRRALAEAEEKCQNDAQDRVEATEHLAVEAQEVIELQEHAQQCREMHEQRYTAWMEVQEEERKKRDELQAIQTDLQEDKDIVQEMKSLQDVHQQGEERLKAMADEQIHLQDLMANRMGLLSCLRPKPRPPQLHSAPAAPKGSSKGASSSRSLKGDTSQGLGKGKAKSQQLPSPIGSSGGGKGVAVMQVGNTGKSGQFPPSPSMSQGSQSGKKGGPLSTAPTKGYSKGGGGKSAAPMTPTEGSDASGVTGS
mmetsp:Transcript_64693/g.154526  ORF Transcript_64693/g.154526 Transcript_64693/m.154526 type:complete len:822 (-) Transcript_64693:209-2674(-)